MHGLPPFFQDVGSKAADFNGYAFDFSLILGLWPPRTLARLLAVSTMLPDFSLSASFHPVGGQGSSSLPDRFAPIYFLPPPRFETFQVRGQSPSGDQTYSKGRITSSTRCGKLRKKVSDMSEVLYLLSFACNCLLTYTSYCQQDPSHIRVHESISWKRRFEGNTWFSL